jgi:hypothetical protein
MRRISIPRHAERAALRVHLDRAFETALRNTYSHRSAGTGATGERLADAALVDAQRDAVGIEGRTKSDIDAPGKARVMFQGRP